jgi:hypothetical protein
LIDLPLPHLRLWRHATKKPMVLRNAQCYRTNERKIAVMSRAVYVV